MDKATPTPESAEPFKFKNAALLNRLSEMAQVPYYATACHTLIQAEMAIVELERENATLRAEVERLAAQSAPTDTEMVLVPPWKGYALLGTGNYILNSSAAPPDPKLGAEFFITFATDADKSGNRQVGETRANDPNAAPVQPEEMVLRIGFLTPQALCALEGQLRVLREENFPESVAAQPSQAPVVLAVQPEYCTACDMTSNDKQRCEDCPRRASSGAAQAAPFAKDSWQHAVDNQLVAFGRTSQEFVNPHEAMAWLAEMHMELGVSNAGATQAVRMLTREELNDVALSEQAGQIEVRFQYESMKPVEGFDAIYAKYATTFGRYPDDFMAGVVRQTKEDLFMWWGAHREKIRAGLALLAAQESAAAQVEPAELTNDQITAGYLAMLESIEVVGMDRAVQRFRDAVSKGDHQ